MAPDPELSARLVALTGHTWSDRHHYPNVGQLSHRGKALVTATEYNHIEASPAAVHDLLPDGWNYSQWVVGTTHVRAVDAGWPQPGSRLHHAAGPWPVVVRDHTEMRELEPGRRLLMTAKGWPLGEAEVEILLTSEESGTGLTLREHGTGGAGRLLRNP